MNLYDKSISNQLEWTQAGLDAIKALPPDTRAKLAEHEHDLWERKGTLEKHITRKEA